MSISSFPTNPCLTLCTPFLVRSYSIIINDCMYVHPHVRFKGETLNKKEDYFFYADSLTYLQSMYSLNILCVVGLSVRLQRA